MKQFFVKQKLGWWKNSWLSSENVYYDETNPKTDLADHHTWWNTFYVQMEAGLMKVVQCLNRNWTHDSYFSLRESTV